MTINDIAKLANTSRGTVDRVINKRGKVKKELEDKILKIIKETGYKPNAAGRSLRLTNNKLKIGVIIASKESNFYKLIEKGIKSRAEFLKNSCLEFLYYEVDLYSSKDYLKAINKLKSENISGLLITSTIDENINKEIEKLNVPVVSINININAPNQISYIGTDYENSGKLLANFMNLIIHEETHIGLFVDSHNLISQQTRYLAFKNSLNNLIVIDSFKESYDDIKITYNLTLEMIKENPKIKYILYLGGGSTGGIRAIVDSKSDIKALTIEQNDEIFQYLKNDIVLAIVHKHPYSQGYKAVDLIYNYLLRNKKPEQIKLLPNDIMLKESNFSHKLD